MALLVGDNTNHATARGLANGILRYLDAGFVAAASGSATSVFLKCDNWAGLSNSQVKVVVFFGGVQIAISDAIAVPATTPSVVSAAFSSPPSITMGNTYYIALIPSSGQIEIYDDNTSQSWTDCGGTYSFADPSGATFAGTGQVAGNPHVYLDGASGRASKNTKPFPLGMELGMHIGMGGLQ